MLTEVTTGVAGTSDPVTGTLVRSAEDTGRMVTGVSRGMVTDLVGSSNLVTVIDPAGNSDRAIVTEDTRIGLVGTSSHVMATDPTESSDPVTGMVTGRIGTSSHATATDHVGTSDPVTGMVTDLVGNSDHVMAIGLAESSDPVTVTDLVGSSDLVTMMHVTIGNRSMTRGGSSSRPIRRSSSSGVWIVRRTARTISR